MNHPSKRTALSVPGAIVLSLVLVAQALAHTWSAPIPITSGFAGGLVGLNGTTADIVYAVWNGSAYDVDVTRSTNSGAAWGAPVTLSTNNDDAQPGISGLDPFVDVVWRESNSVMYANSANGGQNFGLPLVLQTGGFPINLSVGRGAGGLVIVAWQNGKTYAIKTRVSTNGGATFGPTKSFSSNVQDMGTSVAAGDGVVYLAYKTTLAKLRVRRSTDGGVTWSGAGNVTNDGVGVFGEFDVTADGTHAYIGYTVRNPNNTAWGAVRYRRTLDSGMTWSAEFALAPPTWKTEEPAVTLQNGVLRAAYARRTSSGHAIYYQQSSDGVNWSSAEQVNPNGNDPDVGRAGNIIVVYGWTGGSYVRLGT
jgi:hypothetical protein